VFFTLYSGILFFCALIFYISEASALEIVSILRFNVQEKARIFILLMSIGGLPPLLGFYMKLIILTSLLGHLKIVIILTMIMASVLMIYLYLRAILRAITLAPLSPISTEPHKFLRYPIFIVLIYVCSPLILLIY